MHEEVLLLWPAISDSTLPHKRNEEDLSEGRYPLSLPVDQTYDDGSTVSPSIPRGVRIWQSQIGSPSIALANDTVRIRFALKMIVYFYKVPEK